MNPASNDTLAGSKAAPVSRLAVLARGAALAAVGLAAAMSVPSPVSSQTAGKNVVILSWDGVRRDVLTELLEWQPVGSAPQECPWNRHAPTFPVLSGAFYTCLPNFARFQVVDSTAGWGKTHTKPQHAQMLSGFSPDLPEVFKNKKGTKLNPGWSLYEQIQVADGPEVRCGHVAGKKFVGKSVTHFAQRTGALDVSESRGGPDKRTGISSRERAVDALGQLAQFGERFVLFAHFKTADMSAHGSGDYSVRYREAIIQNDLRLGELLTELAAAGFDETNTVVYITTDHGFNGKNHTNRSVPSNYETFLASNAWNLTPGNGVVHDLVPTVIDTLGLTPSVDLPAHLGVSRVQ